VFIGVGFDSNVGKRRKGYWSVELYYSLGYSRIHEYVMDLEDKGVEFKVKTSPMSISIGYNLILNKF
jgi:hypothetical protein